jgi:hypothetical protein
MPRGSGEYTTVTQAASGPLPKKLGVSHEKAILRVGRGLFLGPWSKALVYAPSLRNWPKTEHRALIQLLRMGRYRVVRVTGSDLTSLLVGVPLSQHANNSFAYVVVPS